MSYLDRIKQKLSEGGYKSIYSEISELSELSPFQARNTPKTPASCRELSPLEGVCNCQPLVDPLQTGPSCQQCGFKIWCSFCGGCRSCWNEILTEVE